LSAAPSCGLDLGVANEPLGIRLIGEWVKVKASLGGQSGEDGRRDEAHRMPAALKGRAEGGIRLDIASRALSDNGDVTHWLAGFLKKNNESALGG